jgi:hypothetical protein
MKELGFMINSHIMREKIVYLIQKIQLHVDGFLL